MERLHWRRAGGLLERSSSPQAVVLPPTQARNSVLAAGQLVEVVKGVFGLSTSPKLWWLKLSGDLKAMEVEVAGDEGLRVEQHYIDPFVFLLMGRHSGLVRGLVLTHVDDLMLTVEPGLREAVQTRLRGLFPIDDWEDDEFDYVGCHYRCTPEAIYIDQQAYCSGRVDKVTILPGQADEAEASREQVEENRTSSLSWLAKQTRPDLQFGVAQAQHRQNRPLVRDLKFTNKMVDAALNNEGKGLVLKKVEEKHMCFLGFHDAAWANVDYSGESLGGEEWLGDHTLSSQLATLILICDRRCLSGQTGKLRGDRLAEPR